MLGPKYEFHFQQKFNGIFAQTPNGKFQYLFNKKSIRNFNYVIQELLVFRQKGAKKGLNISKMTLSHFLTCFEHNGIIYKK